MGSLITTLFTTFTTFAIGLVLVNYFLRYVFENRYLGSKSDYLISNPLVQFLIMMSYSYWISQFAESGILTALTEHDYDNKHWLIIVFMVLASFGAIVVTISTAMSLFHIFRRNGDANFLKTLSYVGIGLIVLTSLIGLIEFSSFEDGKVGFIISFLLLMVLAAWFEYKYCLSIDEFFKHGHQKSYQERVLTSLEANKTIPSVSEPVEQPIAKKFCPNCGEQINASSTICPICSEKTNF